MKQLRSLFLVLLLFLTACSASRVPVPPGTIPQESPMSDSEVQLGYQTKAALLGQFPEVRSEKVRQSVLRITNRLLLAAGSLPSRWEVTILRADEVKNAAATRGNQIFVWTGMLRFARSDAELATVLSHEVGHVLARHVVPTQDEMLREMLSNLGGAVVGQIVDRGVPGAGRLAGGLTSATAKGLIVNPYSQRLELEADTIGLYLMAKAGYDPGAAVGFWERFQHEGGTSLQFFSTHPPSEERAHNLARELPEAMKLVKSPRRLR